MLLRSVCARALRAPAGPRTRARSTAAAAAAAPRADSAAEDWAKAKPYNEIPGPSPLPLVGNAWRFLPVIGEFRGLDLVSLQRELRRRHGPLVRVPGFFSGRDTVFVFDPRLAETVHRNEGIWPIRKNLESVLYYRSVLRKDRFQGSYGVSATQGRDWGDARSKVSKPLMLPASARSYLAPINQVADEFVDRIRVLRDETGELPANFINELNKWALESIATVALDTRLGCLAPDLAPDADGQRIIDAVQIIFEGFYRLHMRPSLWRFVSTPFWRKYVKAMDRFHAVADKYVQQAAARSGEGREQSILQRLLARDPRVAIVVAGDMLLCGIDTTSTAFASLLFLLAKNPEQQETLREELTRELPPGPRPALTDEALPKLPYLRACLRESLRLLPNSTGIARTTPEDMVLGGYQIPQETDVFMCHMLMSRDEQHFPDPERFEPRRWLRGDELAHSAHPFTSLPFGHGVRSCVGRRFAELEIYALVAKIIRNFRVEYHHADRLQYSYKFINDIHSPLNFQLTEL